MHFFCTLVLLILCNVVSFSKLFDNIKDIGMSDIDNVKISIEYKRSSKNGNRIGDAKKTFNDVIFRKPGIICKSDSSTINFIAVSLPTMITADHPALCNNECTTATDPYCCCSHPGRGVLISSCCSLPVCCHDATLHNPLQHCCPLGYRCDIVGLRCLSENTDEDEDRAVVPMSTTTSQSSVSTLTADICYNSECAYFCIAHGWSSGHCIIGNSCVCTK